MVSLVSCAKLARIERKIKKGDSIINKVYVIADIVGFIRL